MIQPRRIFIVGAILLLLITIQSIPLRAAVQIQSQQNTKKWPAFAKPAGLYVTIPDVRFETKGEHYTTYYTSTGMILAGFTSERSPKLSESPQYFELQILPRNALPNVEISTLNPRLSRADFFGNQSPSWLTNIPNYAKVKYTNLYPEVDMLFQVQQREVDVNFVIAPGGDPRKIRLQVQGAEKVRVTPEGTLLLNVSNMTFEMPKPAGYQAFDSSTARSVVQANYVLTGKNEIGLQIAPYDPKRTLIIDR